IGCLLTICLNVGAWYSLAPIAQASGTAETSESTDGIPGHTVGGGTRLNPDTNRNHLAPNPSLSRILLFH
ncbi:MAG: hypothetical protein F6K09_35990, partial [Merismopedia sp. SIO2A8]|nr:hypothetical protein [Merismopedia sp. SIO2A8]